jgi:hypothetical protein
MAIFRESNQLQALIDFDGGKFGLVHGAQVPIFDT